MADTRERILLTALHLFAQDGYEAVSVSTIAGALGMTKGALYKHYKSKRDIFDCIVARMYEIDAQRAQQYQVPLSSPDDSPAGYGSVSWEDVRQFTEAQLLFWTEDAFARDFRRMLTLEQYRSEEMAQLYHGCIVSGPVAYMADIFRAMAERGLLREGDPQQLALEFFAPLFLLIAMSDRSAGSAALSRLLEQHITRFIQHNAAEPL